MKYPQPANGEKRDDPSFYTKGAEKTFTEFIRQLARKQSNGFISEGENGRIFSFETYLRETGHEPDVIAGYCKHASAVNLLKKTAAKSWRFGISFEKGFLKGLLVVTGIGFIVALVLYLLVATLLLIFGVSLWNGRAFLYFSSIVTVLVVLRILLKPKKKGNKNGETGKQASSLYVIKYLDNDELTFAKAKSRLFAQ